MKHKFFKILSILVFLIPILANAQPAQRDTIVTTLYAYRVYLADKANSPYSVSQPEAFLSQRAIDKRNRYNIPITEEDLPVNPAYVDGIRQLSSGFNVWTKSKWTNTVTVFTYDTTHLAELRNLPYVDSIMSIDAYYFYDVRSEGQPELGTRDSIPAVDTSYYGDAYRQIALHNGQMLHSEGFRGEGMLIAVIDGGWEGFNSTSAFGDLYDNGHIVGTYNVLPHESSVYNLTDHGTCCTSTIAANLEYRMVGTAPNADFVFIRTEDVPVERLFEEDFWVRGAEIADSLGADIISSSLGYCNFDDTVSHYLDYSTCDGRWSIASRAATIAAHKGIVVCVAAGNEGMNRWHKLARPSDAEDILCVGAVNVDSIYAPFSGCGPSYDGRVKPDVAACGWDTYVVRADGSIQAGNGTSFATPIIAGLSACLWQAIPQLSSLEIMQIIRESGNQYSNPDTLTGYGIPDFYQAWLAHHTDAISEYQEPSDYTLYPNPCTDRVTLGNAQGHAVRYCLFNLNGQIVDATWAPMSDEVFTINLSGQASGIYFLQIQNEKGRVEVFKVVKK